MVDCRSGDLARVNGSSRSSETYHSEEVIVAQSVDDGLGRRLGHFESISQHRGGRVDDQDHILGSRSGRDVPGSEPGVVVGAFVAIVLFGGGVGSECASGRPDVGLAVSVIPALVQSLELVLQDGRDAHELLVLH